MPVGAAIGVAGAAGAVATTSAAKSNRKAAESTAQQNNATQLQIYNQNQNALSPFMQGGQRSFEAWQALMGLSDVNARPPGVPANDWQGPGTTSPGIGGPPGGQLPAGSGGGFLTNWMNPGGQETPALNPRQYGESALSPMDGVNRSGVNALAMPLSGNLFDQPQINGGPTGMWSANVDGAPGSTWAATPGSPSSGPSAFNQAFDNYRNATGYQFRLNEGTRNLTNAFANTGNLDSGAAQRAMQRFSQDYASGEFNNYLAQLMGGTQIGAGSASALAGVGTSYANSVNANNNAALSARIASNNAMAGGINDFAGNMAGVAGYYYGARPSAYGSTSSLGSWAK